MIHAVGHLWVVWNDANMSKTSSRSSASNNNGPQMKMVWQRMMRLETAEGELLQLPHILRACFKIWVCSVQLRNIVISTKGRAYIGLGQLSMNAANSKLRTRLIV